MRRFLKRLFCLPAMMMLGAVAPSQGSLKTSGDYDYVPLEDGTVMITKYRGTEKNLTVPAVLNGKRVSGIWDRAFKEVHTVERIIVPEGITSIGDGAFSWCQQLTSVSLPDSVTYVGVNPFANCIFLKDIQISPAHPILAKINHVLFHKKEKRLICRPAKLESSAYAIPNNIREIDAAAFSHNYNLRSVSIPDSVSVIRSNPFMGCTALRKIEVSPDHPVLTVIDGALFHSRERRLICIPANPMKDAYTIPDGTLIVDDYAMSFRDSLSRVTIPDSVQTWGTGVFLHSRRIKQIQVSPRNSALAIIDGMLCHKAERRLLRCPVTLTKCAIPQGICHIDAGAFLSCRALRAVALPDTVVSIGHAAFFNCDALTSVTLPASVAEIGDRAFEFCSRALTFTVTRGSYAEQWARAKGYKHICSDPNDWLNS